MQWLTATGENPGKMLASCGFERCVPAARSVHDDEKLHRRDATAVGGDGQENARVRKKGVDTHRHTKFSRRQSFGVTGCPWYKADRSE